MLNWLTRYTPAALAALHDAGSILDVGCGPHGLACIAPDVPFVGTDVAFDGEPAPSMVPVELEERVDENTLRFGAARGAADLAPDALGTDAAWYLDVAGAAALAELPA